MGGNGGYIDVVEGSGVKFASRDGGVAKNIPREEGGAPINIVFGVKVDDDELNASTPDRSLMWGCDRLLK
ncbi:hypothetical protein GOBAR_AA36051 [Gossypium barbadense]|uniref:Uncharacterized protein n=1 Tax=Gossypium barbadense TaxID=3634 RepID=A0A2P5W0N8_GOSBA|nr:hypothetical protein GOBAR_AA36051 [Gossypium barbadense]